MKHYQRWLAAALIGLCTAVLPLSVLANCGCSKGGMIYNQTDGKYYSIPDKKNCMVYRSDDDDLLPVAKYGHCKGKMHRHHMHKSMKPRVVNVRCNVVPGHWSYGVWMPESNQCWYIIRK